MKINHKKIRHLDDWAELISNVTVSLARWQQQKSQFIDRNIGVRLELDDEIELLADINLVPFLVLDFADFEDGRVYSKLRILRNLLAYTGEIGAVNAHLDQLQIMARSGVDWFQLSSEYSASELEKYIKTNSICYQYAHNNSGLVNKFN